MEKKPLNIKIIMNIMVAIVIILIASIAWTLLVKKDFELNDLTIELGSDSVLIANYLNNELGEDTEILTDLAALDFSLAGEYVLEVSTDGEEKIIKLKIVDTTSPVVEFKNITKPTGYVVNAEDFIVMKEDMSEVSISATQISDTSQFKNHSVEVIVTDLYGNETAQNCILTISWLTPEVVLELGSDFSKSLIIGDMEKDGSKISESDYSAVDTMKVGEYIIKATYENNEYESKIIVQDTTPPTLELENLKTYINKSVTKDDFIKKASDISGEVTVTMGQTLDVTKAGEYSVAIEAVDINDNKIVKTATLTVIKDEVGPLISGLSNITVNKYSSINYTYGVSAYDDNDGVSTFTVNSSKVNTSKAGTYYASYTAKDKSGNTRTYNRKIVINHDQEDTDNKFNEFYNNYLAGKDALGMANFIKSNISYNYSWGGDDPVWYGLTNNAGNCYVHALIYQKALNKAGVTNKLISIVDKSHYWNLLYIGGVWRHYDSTPGSHIVGPATDIEKFESDAMKNRDWDRSAYPVAE